MKKRLSALINLQTGIYTKPQPNGQVYYVQARHFDENKEFISSVKPDLELDIKLEKHYLQIGDVLVAAKGANHFAIAYKGIIKPAVASSMFIVLRIKNKKILLPEFLAWFINNPTTQSILAANEKGTSIPSINKGDLEALEISLPSLQKQQSILQIQSLRKQEVSLQKQMDDLREKYIHQLITSTLK